ncbi:uncharacterized protein LOC142345522 [Convolutriloba macropyga]|uniref:uncharacterized protein LOC142345522 n=1 Tax=Convolutriloba macropyga TaxID=536237 RepID=UPI003F527E49
MSLNTNKEGDYISSVHPYSTSNNDLQPQPTEPTEKTSLIRSGKIVISIWHLVLLITIQLASLVALLISTVLIGIMMSNMKSDHVESENRIRTLEQNMDQLENDFDESQSPQILNNLSVSSNRVDELDLRLKELNYTCAKEYSTRMIELQSDTSELNSSVIDVTNELNILENDVNENTGALGTLQLKVTRAELDITSLQSDIAVIENYIGLK